VEKKSVIIITNGYSSFISNLHTARIVEIIGVLDCAGDKKLENYVHGKNIPYKTLIQQDKELQKWIKEKNVSLIIVYKMPFLLKKEVYSIPKYGSINIHPSLLPQYRGPNPWFWIYFNMEKESGVTIHRIDEREDHGEVLAQTKFDIKLGVNLKELQSIVEIKSIFLLKELLPKIETIKGKSQDSYFSSFKAYNVANYKLIIDINKIDVANLWHLLRGFPWLIPILYSNFKHKGKYKIKSYVNNIFENENIGNVKEDESNIFLYCKNGIIEVQKYRK
jgi:methionyl-tRNA formyltransferase